MAPWWAALIGVIIGGALSGFTAYFVELQRWRRTRRDKLDEAKKEAIEAAFAWLEPMYKAVRTAEGQAFRLLNPGGDDDGFRRDYPDLLSTLAKLDIPIQKRLLLPEATYHAGNEIVRNVEAFQYEALDLWERTKFYDPPLDDVDARQKCAERALAMRKQIEELQRTLEKAYQSTFE